MQLKKYIGPAAAGICAGAVNGLFGAGGGMVLVPLLTLATDMEDSEIFPASVSIILPICIVSLAMTFQPSLIPWRSTITYLAASAAGGALAGLIGKRIPTTWLHRILGILILWGGLRYIC